MVQNRLPFLDGNSATNEELVSEFTLEIMNELEICFLIDEGNTGATLVGDEQYYSIAQRVVIADLVSCYILMVKALAETGGTSDTSSIGTGVTTPASNKELVETTAGSVGVKWSKFDLTKDAGLKTNADKLLAMYKASAIRKAKALGCIIDICGDCEISVVNDQSNFLTKPFIVYTGGGDCGCQ